MTSFDLRPFDWRGAALGLAVLGAASLGSHLGAAAETSPATHAVGAWDLALDNGSKQCRMMLRADVAQTGYGVGMPIGCHMAFPFLVTVKAWQDVGDGKLRLEDGAGQPVVSFDPAADGALSGTGPDGAALVFKMAGPHHAMVLRTAAKVDAAKTATSEALKVSPKLPLPSVSEAAGHYSVLRKLGHDTGCMVTLDDKARGPGGTMKANLAPACRDQGIVIFDPVGWQFQAGQLVLTARKGHTTNLDLQPDGTWARETKEGVSLGLKRM